MKEIEIGDVVTLKSGGPRMTVLAFGEDTADETKVVSAGWFNNGADTQEDPDSWTLEQAEFPVTTLNVEDDE